MNQRLAVPENRNETQSAEDIAIEALGFVANDPRLLGRFLDITGIDASGIRAAAGQPGFLAGVLQFIAAHEPTLLAFCSATGIRPESIMKAMRSLPLGDDEYHRST